MSATPNTPSQTCLFAGQTGEAQALTITVRSSDPSLLPDPTPSALSGGQVTLTCIPAGEAAGTAIITVTVSDEASIPAGTPDPARSTAITFQVVIAAVTGWGQVEDRRRTSAAGFDHHLVKPVDPDVLERLVSELPRRHAI